MGLLCTLRFTIRHLVACPSIPLFLCPSLCTFKCFSVPCLQRLSHSVASSIKDGLGEGRSSDRARQKALPRTSSGGFLQSGVFPGSPAPLPGLSTYADDEGAGPDTLGKPNDSSSIELDLPTDDGDRTFSMQLLSRGKARNGGNAETPKVFRVTKENLEQRSQIVRSLLQNILNLQDIESVGYLLREWLRNFVSSGHIFSAVGNFSDHGDPNDHISTGRFVPYSQVARIVHAVMRDLGQGGHLEAALEVLRWMEGQGWCQLDPHMYTTIIATLGEAGSFELAEKIFESLDSTPVVKDAALYNAMLNARGKAGQIDSLEDLFESMKQSACKPDLITYNTVMNCYVKAGLGLGTVVGIFREMYSRGIDPDLVSFDILLQACIPGRHVKEAQKIFENLKRKGLEPSVVTYTTLITLYANSGHRTEALELLSDMLAENCLPNSYTFSALITACGRDGNVEEAERLCEAMKELGVEPNVVTYNAMIDMYGKAGNCLMAQQKYRELELAGLKPTSVTFASLMSSLKAAGAYDEAFVLYDQAKKVFLCNEHVFTEAIDTCIKWDKFQRVKAVQSDMVAVNCNPTVVTCSIILAALGSKCTVAEDAAVLVNFLQGFDSDLAVMSCKLLLEQLSSDEQVLHNIHRLYSLLDKEEMKTWSVFTSSLVDALWVLGWYRRAAHVVAWVMERGLFDDICVIQPREWKLDLRRLSSGIALVALYQWLGHLLTVARHLEDLKSTNSVGYLNSETLDVKDNDVRMSGKAFEDFKSVVPLQVEVLLPLLPALSELAPNGFQSAVKSEIGGEHPPLVTIVTGWGKLSKQEGSSIVKSSICKEMVKLRSPFRPSVDSGRWMAKGELLMPWLLIPETAALLALSDLASEVDSAQS